MPCSWILRIAHSNSAARLVFLFHWARLSCESDSSPMTRPRQPIVVGDPDAALAEPLLAQRRHAPEQLLGVAPVRREVVVHEQQVPAELPQLVDDLVDGPRAETLVEERRDRTEAARVRAAASRLHRVDGRVARAADQRAVGDRQAGEGHRTRHVAALERAPTEVRDHLRHPAFGLADAVRVLLRFIRHQAGVIAAHDDRLAARAEPVRDLVGARRVERHERDPAEFRVGLEVDRLDFLVDDADAHVRRHRCRHVKARQHREPEELRPAGRLAAGRHAPLGCGRIDEQELAVVRHWRPHGPGNEPGARRARPIPANLRLDRRRNWTVIMERRLPDSTRDRRWPGSIARRRTSPIRRSGFAGCCGISSTNVR
jgi:hypothetical protein